jgi:hypothetical protein
MDNLFTTLELLSYLRKNHIGAAWTVRTGHTRREIKETPRSQMSRPSQPSQTLDDDNDNDTPATATGINRRLVVLKTSYTGCLDWGELFVIAKENVLQFAWRDAQLVHLYNHPGRESAMIRPRKRLRTACQNRNSL